MRSHAAILMSLALFATPALAQQTPEELSLDEKLSLNFQNTRLETVLTAIRDTAEINLVADPAVDTFNRSVSANASDESVGKLLDDLQEQLELQRMVWAGAIYLYPKGKAPPEAQAFKDRALMTRVRLVDFQRTPLSEVITRLKNRAKQEFAVQSFAVRRHMKKRTGVTLKLHRARLGDVLNHVCRNAGLTWKLEGGKVVFGVANPTKVEAGDEGGIDFDVMRGDTFDKGPKVDVDKLVRQLSNVRMRGTAARLLVREGKAVSGKVAAILKDADPTTQLAALEVLSEIGDPSVYAEVLTLFKSGESLDLRTAAGVTLGEIKAPEAVPALIEALNDPWFKISETARQSLIAIGSPAVKDLLATFEKEASNLKGRDGIIYRALLVFGEIADKDCKVALLKAIKTSKGKRAVPIRHHAAIALGMTDDVRLVEPLIAALKRERDFRVAKYIARSLSWITDHHAGNTGDRWEIWWELEGRKKLLRPSTTAKVMEGVGGEVRVPVDDQGFARLESDAQRLARLTKELGSKDAKTRRSAWRDLESMGEAALPALKETLISGNPKAKANAKAVIARIQEKAGLPE